jgi:hypothetical protein
MCMPASRPAYSNTLQIGILASESRVDLFSGDCRRLAKGKKMGSKHKDNSFSTHRAKRLKPSAQADQPHAVSKARYEDAPEDTAAVASFSSAAAARATSSSTHPPSEGLKIKRLVPPRPWLTVPVSASSSVHKEGKNYICITRKTRLSAYLRRCKDVILKDW